MKHLKKLYALSCIFFLYMTNILGSEKRLDALKADDAEELPTEESYMINLHLHKKPLPKRSCFTRIKNLFWKPIDLDYHHFRIHHITPNYSTEMIAKKLYSSARVLSSKTAIPPQNQEWLSTTGRRIPIDNTTLSSLFEFGPGQERPIILVYDNREKE